MSDEAMAATATVLEWAGIEVERFGNHATRRRVMGERVMLARFEFEPGFEVSPHVHENEQISVVESGHLLFTVGTIGTDELREESVRAGQLIVLPSNVPHGAKAIEPSVVYDLFSPPSEKTGIDQQAE